MKYCVLFNPLACSGKCESLVKGIKLPEGASVEYCGMSGDKSYREIIETLEKDVKIILCGGDGTLNRFVNSTADLSFENEILFLPAGSGNDFLNDIGKKESGVPVRINEYLENLPTAYVNNKAYRFVNGVGYGIDGYCCREVNRLKGMAKKASYTLIALKGLLFAYKPTGAAVRVDGKEYRYKKVWLSPTMKGKFFGGGMMIAPNQNRNNADNTLTVVVAHNLSKLKIVSLFPTIFKGNHIKYTDNVAVHTGKSISVKFDNSADLQMDGETILDVAEYRVEAVPEKAIV